MEKIDARKLSTETQQQLRNQAIRLRISGKKYREISEITWISATTICTWYKAYLDGGKSAYHVQNFLGFLHLGCSLILLRLF
ncbi:hypothetical protein [Desulfatiferula olefinivorans]